MVGSLGRFLQQILSSLPVAATIIDINGKILTWNLMAEHITGYSQDEMTGQPCSHLGFVDCRNPCSLRNASDRSTIESASSVTGIP